MRANFGKICIRSRLLPGLSKFRDPPPPPRVCNSPTVPNVDDPILCKGIAYNLPKCVFKGTHCAESSQLCRRGSRCNDTYGGSILRHPALNWSCGDTIPVKKRHLCGQALAQNSCQNMISVPQTTCICGCWFRKNCWCLLLCLGLEDMQCVYSCGV